MAETNPTLFANAATDEGPSPDELDELLGVLEHARRRRLLDALDAAGGSRSVDDLAAAVARRESDGDPAPDEVDSVRLSLVHSHLPKCRQASVVRYDEDAGRVAAKEGDDAYAHLVAIRDAVTDLCRDA